MNFGLEPDGEIDPFPEGDPEIEIDPNGDPFDPLPPADDPLPPVDPPAEDPPVDDPPDDEDCDDDVDGVPGEPEIADEDGELTTTVDTPVTTESITEQDLGELVTFTQPENGRLICNTDGTFTYTPDTGFVGEDCFSYTLECDNGSLTTYVHHVTVTECNDEEVPPPVEPPPVEPPPVEPPPVEPPPIVPQVEYKTDYEDGGETGGLHWGDPHFVGDDGGKYDIQGVDGGVYNMLSDADIQYNARFAAWGNGGATVVDAIGVTVWNSQVGWEVGTGPTLNGVAIAEGETTQFEGGSVSWQGNDVVVETEEYSLTFKNNGNHINGDYVAKNPFGDEVGAHGLWGQTVDAGTEAVSGDIGAGAQGGGAIETVDADGNVVLSQAGDTQAVELYRVNDLFATEGANDNTFFYYGAERGTGLEACEPMEVVPEAPEPEPAPEPAPVPDPVPEPTADPEPPIAVDPEPEEECEEEPVPDPVPEPEPEVNYDTVYTDGSDKGGKHWGDPHFVGDDGGNYDVQGVAGNSYNMLSDNGLQYNARFGHYANGATIVDAVGITTNDHQVGWEVGQSPTFDGVALQPGDSFQSGDVTVQWVGNQFTVETEEYELKFIQRSGLVNYFDGEYVAKDPFQDEVGAHGLWGQTVDGDTDAVNGDRGSGAQGGGAIETVDENGNVVVSRSGDRQAVEQYEVNDLFATEGKNSNEFFHFDAERGRGLEVLKE